MNTFALTSWSRGFSSGTSFDDLAANEGKPSVTGVEGAKSGRLGPASPGRPPWFLVLLMIALAIGIANVGIFIYGFTLPGTWNVRETVVIRASPDEIFPLLSDSRRWAEWSIWNIEEDATLTLSYDKAGTGNGEFFAWSGEMLGHGKLVLTDSVPNRSVSYELELQREPFSDEGKISLEPLSGGTKVVWTDGGKLEGTLQRLFRERLESAVSSDLSRCLHKLKVHVESLESEQLKRPSSD